jgi:glycosyltransferase involved in cell wall biosynthesis
MSTLTPSKMDLSVKTKLADDAGSLDTSTAPKLLAISYSYPPKEEPRAIQVSRLLKHLNASTVLICEGEDGVARNSNSDAESFLDRTLRVPFSPSSGRDLLRRISSRIYLPVVSRTPDHLGPWKKSVLKTVDQLLNLQGYRPDVLVTFAFPLIDNLIGLELKRRYNLPWLAHFSDPWVDSPFRNDDPLTKTINARLEQSVIENADRLVFTSNETAMLVMDKYRSALRSKVRIVSHAFEPDLFDGAPHATSGRLSIRYLGDLYHNRTPEPLFQALEILSWTDPELLSRFCFEIVGDVHELDMEQMGLSRLPPGLVVFPPRVNYAESLLMMSSSAGLMVIDAPVPKNTESVFLPSKLIEYVGADRPIIGLTPPGTAAYLIARLGGWVADPGSADQVAEVLREFLMFVWERRDQRAGGWARSEVRSEFEVKAVARKFQEVLAELM